MTRSSRKPIIGVMGGARVSDEVNEMAWHLGRLIAAQGWILLNGGRNAGVMLHSARGAKEAGGQTIGVLPDDSKESANDYIDIPIVTNLADARNLINVLSSDVVVACPGSAGTISEVALALKNDKKVILLRFKLSDFDYYKRNGRLFEADSPEECIDIIKRLLDEVGPK